MASTIPATVPVYATLVDDIDDVLAADQNNPNADISALATLVGMFGTGKTQGWGTDIISSMLNAQAVIFSKSSATALAYTAGFVWVANSGQSIRLPRRITSGSTLTIADLDTGSTVAVGWYYIYATAGSAGTTPVLKISTSNSAPTGFTEYELLAAFYNETAGAVLDITNAFICNIKRNGRDVPNTIGKNSTVNFVTSSTSLVNDTEALLHFYCSGRPTKISYSVYAPVDTSSLSAYQLSIDGSDVACTLMKTSGAGYGGALSMSYVAGLAAGTHTIQGRCFVSAGTGTFNPRSIIVEES